MQAIFDSHSKVAKSYAFSGDAGCLKKDVNFTLWGDCLKIRHTVVNSWITSSFFMHSFQLEIFRIMVLFLFDTLKSL